MTGCPCILTGTARDFYHTQVRLLVCEILTENTRYPGLGTTLRAIFRSRQMLHPKFVESTTVAFDLMPWFVISFQSMAPHDPLLVVHTMLVRKKKHTHTKHSNSTSHGGTNNQSNEGTNGSVNILPAIPPTINPPMNQPKKRS